MRKHAFKVPTHNTPLNSMISEYLNICDSKVPTYNTCITSSETISTWHQNMTSKWIKPWHPKYRHIPTSKNNAQKTSILLLMGIRRFCLRRHFDFRPQKMDICKTMKLRLQKYITKWSKSDTTIDIIISWHYMTSSRYHQFMISWCWWNHEYHDFMTSGDDNISYYDIEIHQI